MPQLTILPKELDALRKAVAIACPEWERLMAPGVHKLSFNAQLSDLITDARSAIRKLEGRR